MDYAFADSLKQACMILYNLSPEQLIDQELKETVDEFWGVTPRHLMKTTAQTLKSALGVNPFVQKFRQWYSHNTERNVVVSDVRFEDEASAIVENGGIIIRIIRPSLGEEEPDETESFATYGTNPMITHHVVNDGTVEELVNKIKTIIYQ